MTAGDLMRAEAKAKAEGTMSVYNGAELTDEGARYWLTLDGWDADQSAYLLCAIDPRKLNRWAQMNGGKIELGGFPAHFDSLVSVLAVAFETGALHSPLAKPSDVIAWAKSKELRLPRQFLDAQFDGTKKAAPVTVGASNPSNEVAIPGKLPNTSMGKLAIKAAWLIEGESKRAATAKQVMARLQDWADGGHEPATLLKSDKKNHAVIWITGKRVEKPYDIEACGKTLETWMASRA